MSSTHIMRMDAVEKATGLSRATIRRMMARDAFPKAVLPEGRQRAIGWWKNEVRQWIAENRPSTPRAPLVVRTPPTERLAVVLTLHPRQLTEVMRMPNVELLDVSAA